ncbi:hypothetical protein SDRG_12170 [Saprolegnia diclina VS20]|uniref:Uncharacterized protein n=1 Tax=Saprolegnia diclina (strain VS20) TaxID=1156394 RepID=T0Q9F7_SAPDV|nr:hypothetical protein SDRG_12170 [Saprolegnia diclina VS20]EQC30110.1 hypothetical protein SDRG_12170 [Saprolegnia diclina VS20]|eukprot:XP_008616453.1 hypothetical protein SDRG_12170 [Saprolegnia diclina VS20]
MTAYFGRATMAVLTAGLAYMIYSNATSTPTDATDDAPTTTTMPLIADEQQHDLLDTDLDEPEPLEAGIELPQLDAATVMELLEDTQQRHVDAMQASLDASTATAATLQRQLDASSAATAAAETTIRALQHERDTMAADHLRAIDALRAEHTRQLAATQASLAESNQQVATLRDQLDASIALQATTQASLDTSVQNLAHQALASLHKSAAADEVIRNLQLELNAANVTVEVVTMDAARALDKWHRAVSSRLFECPRCGGIDDTPIMIESDPPNDDEERWSCEDSMPMSAILAVPPPLPSIAETPEELTDDIPDQRRRRLKKSKTGLWPFGHR